MNFTTHDLMIFLLNISIMLLFAKVFGEIFIKIKQPAIIGEIIAGIILGPTVFGTFLPGLYNDFFVSSPQIQTALDGIVSIAVVMLLLVLGLEVDLSVIIKNSKVAMYTSLMGMIFPFVLGFTASYYFPGLWGIKDESMRLVFALFIGTAMSISALPVIARTLLDLNIFRTQIGLTIIASAMFGDIAGWLIFSVILGMLDINQSGLSFSNKILFIIFFVIIMLTLGRKLIHKVLPYLQKKLTYPGGVINFIFIIGFLCAALTEYIGVHAIFGAFILGIAVGDSSHLKEKTKEIVQQFVNNIFAPLFFVSIGLEVNFMANFDVFIVLGFLVIAFAGKVIGSGLGAYWGGMNKNDSLAIGFGMNSRGTMEIILGLLAYEYQLIHASVFVALVIMALVTSVSSAPLMSIFLRKRKGNSFHDFVKTDNLIFTDDADKKTLLEKLILHASGLEKFDSSSALNDVMRREDELPTGITNYLAIPHAKINIENPVVVIAVNKTGIDFSAIDQLPSRIIILLLTPSGQNELQLKLLSEIAAAFSDKEKVELLLKETEKKNLLEKIEQLSKIS